MNLLRTYVRSGPMMPYPIVYFYDLINNLLKLAKTCVIFKPQPIIFIPP